MNDTTEVPDNDADNNGSTVYHLKLYITGASPNSVRAVNNLKNFCDHYLKNNYELKIIDVHQQPLLAESEQIIALPLLIKTSPGTERRLIGDMSNTDKILRGLEIIAFDK